MESCHSIRLVATVSACAKNKNKTKKLQHSSSFGCSGEDLLPKKHFNSAKDARSIQLRKEERATYYDRRHGGEVRSLSSWPGTLGSWGLALCVAQWSGSWHIQPPAASRRLPPPPLRPISRGHTPPLAHKVGQTKPWTQFSLSQFLISHLFLGSNPRETKHSAQISPYKKYIHQKKKRKEKVWSSPISRRSPSSASLWRLWTCALLRCCSSGVV